MTAFDPILLQSFGDSCYFGGSALTCLLDQLVAAFGGEAIFGLLAGAGIFLVFWVASEGDLAAPTVALVLTGSVSVAMVPAGYQDLAYGVVVVGLAAVLWAILKQYVFAGAPR